MRAVILRYRIYKDRFYLSISVSIVLHIIGMCLYFLIPLPHKELTLRPISLGMLQPNAMPSQQNQSTQQEVSTLQQSKPFTTKNTQPIKKTSNAPTMQDNTKSLQKPSPPSTNIDLQTLNIPDNNEPFHPLATQKPSLTQSLEQLNDNAKFEELPSVIKDKLYKLYGTELNSMSKEDKDYLAESYFINAEVFQQTADKMGYPALAQQLQQQGRGTIEFILNPDGSITDIVISTSTGYEALDDSMRRTVEQSAKNLKRPPKPIKIILDGDYRIYQRLMP